MKRILIILNGFYPYQRCEDYLSNEVRYIKGFDKVICFPIHVYKEKSTDDILYYPKPPQNIDIRNSVYSYRKRTIRNFFFILQQKLFYDEIRFILKSRKSLLSKIKAMLRTSFQSANAYFDIRKVIENELDKESDIYVYSYWMAGPALTATLLRDKGISIKKIFSRCHRFDVYEYANKIDYIPFRKYILSKLDNIYSISEDAKLYLENKYAPIVKNKIVVSRLGTFDYGVHYSPKNNVLKIMSCSWLRPVKRVDLLFHALETLTDFNIEWTHYGDGEEMPKLQKLIQSKQNENLTIVFAGAKSNKEVLEIYQNTDVNVFVNVSANEGVPVSIMEAMSFGKIIIATNVGGTSEIVENGVNGYLLTENPSKEEIANAVRNVYNYDDETYLNACKSSRNIWEIKSDAAKNYQSFYKSIGEDN